MGKIIVYTIQSNGVDGREPTKIDYASCSEDARDEIYASTHLKQYYSKHDRIIEPDAQRKHALAKLDGLDRLCLGLEQKEL